MASLEDGTYRLRAVTTHNPDPGVGGEYATVEGARQPVQAEPNTPPFFERQIWQVTRNADGQYTIKYQGLNAPFEYGFSYDQLEPNAPVIAGDPKEYILQLVPSTADVYIIRAPIQRVGVDVEVGVQGNTLVYKFFPVDGSGGDRPAWRFTRE
uniref:Clitocypin analog n=1 Tax=Clitocybe nebularis TaxID=117024 RepID=UPI0001BE64EB|nr:Chain B, Clitocypin analog [Clitocybe nebularis]